MKIYTTLEIIDATVSDVNKQDIKLSTVTASLQYISAEIPGYIISGGIIPMSPPSIIIPSLVMPYSHLRTLPPHLQRQITQKIGGSQK